MNGGGGQLRLPGPPGGRLPAFDFLSLAHRELRRYLLPLSTIFAVIALLFLAWGLVNPPTYKSSATVLVEDNSAIAPLMEGRTLDQEYASRAVISRDLLFSRRVMEDVVRAGGWISGRPDPVEMDGLIKGVIGRTDIEVTEGGSGRSSNPGLSLVKITYADSDPERAYRVAKRFSEALIEQVLDSKARASRTAYQFIDAQVGKYESALAAADSRLQAYRSENPDAMPGVEADVAARIAELRRAVDMARMDLADVGAQERQVIGSLSRESQVATIPRASQVNARLAALQAEQDRLLLTYTEKHPDVVLVRNQIRQVQSQAANPGASAAPAIPGAAPTLNPVYSQIRGQLVDVRRQGAAAASRVATAQALLAEELERSRRILEDQGEVAALTRAQDVNREMYEDLLKRRENARVSMTLDADGRSLGFQIQEPASVPLAPSGVQFVHFATAGLLLATLVPMLLLALVVRHDPRARSALQIERDAGLPVIASIPSHGVRDGAAMQGARRFSVATLLLVAVPVVYALAMMLKLGNVL